VGRSPWPPAFDRFHKRIQREKLNRMPIEVLAATTMLLAATRLLRR
jgi:hypothetical protein